jgi:pimeloyl-ACP methyl ester carboxylesterase
MQAESRTIDLDGPVHYLDYGGAGPTVVLVHGLGGSHANWLAVGSELARGARVLALDLAGFGRTPLGGRSADIHANRILLDRFLAAVVGEPAILIGNSMGGLLVMMEAALAPTRVAGLVLVAPAQPRPSGMWVDGRVAALFTMYALPVLGEAFLGWRARLLGPAGVVRSTLALCCVDPARIPAAVVEAHVALARERLERMPWANQAFLEATRSLIGALARRSWFTDIVRQIDAPTLLIQGDGDRLVSAAASRQLAAMRPDWSFEPWADVGHVPQLEQPARFVASVRHWLAGQPVAAASR